MKMVELKQSRAFLTYEGSLKNHRIQFSDYLEPFLSEKDPRIVMLFWIHFSYMGVGMTEPVEHWIRRAGEACKKLGFAELGTQLCKHAIHEADHHLMMIEDAKRLIVQWNALYRPTLEVEALLEKPLRECVVKYRDLHEHTITGKTPYCQIAIEYEIENLSAGYGKEIMHHTYRILGEEIKESLSFIEEHAVIDVAHTLYNQKALSNFLEAYPEAEIPLARAGAEALESYGNFLFDCYTLAKNYPLS